MDRRVWQITVHGITEGQTELSSPHAYLRESWQPSQAPHPLQRAVGSMLVVS